MKQGGCQPGPRSGMAAVSGPQPNRAYFFGGVCDREEDEETITSVCLADLYMLETDRGLWREMDLKKEVRYLEIPHTCSYIMCCRINVKNRSHLVSRIFSAIIVYIVKIIYSKYSNNRLYRGDCLGSSLIILNSKKC